MAGNSTRLEAIGAVLDYELPFETTVGAQAPGELFGCNVFSKLVMQQRLPKPVFKSLLATIEDAVPLDPTIADVVASTPRRVPSTGTQSST